MQICPFGSQIIIVVKTKDILLHNHTLYHHGQRVTLAVIINLQIFLNMSKKASIITLLTTTTATFLVGLMQDHVAFECLSLLGISGLLPRLGASLVSAGSAQDLPASASQVAGVTAYYCCFFFFLVTMGFLHAVSRLVSNS